MKIRNIAFFLAAMVVALIAVNFFRVDAYAREATKGRDFMTADAYYRYGVLPGSIVFDLRDVGPAASGAGVIGGFFEFAEKMKDRDFAYIYLAYHGNIRFRLSGDKFKEIGETLKYQNPVYLVRTLPENIETPDGRPAFSRWSGGLLGVLSSQMDDVNDFTRKWWMNDEIASY